jgi:hypothetical protein
MAEPQDQELAEQAGGGELDQLVAVEHQVAARGLNGVTWRIPTWQQ